jgi:hypothetical protein
MHATLLLHELEIPDAIRQMPIVKSHITLAD